MLSLIWHNFLLQRDRRFEKLMRKRGFIIKLMGQDGACLFRSVADQVYGDQEMHAVVRNHCMDYIVSMVFISVFKDIFFFRFILLLTQFLTFQAANRDFFSQYLTEDVGSYVNRKRKHNVHGNHIEMQALSEMYNRPVEVFCYRSGKIYKSSKFLNSSKTLFFHANFLFSLTFIRSNQHLSWYAQN